MNILLDTHVLLWTFNADVRLKEDAIKLISNPKNTIYYSVASVWEVSLKHQKNPAKLNISGTEFIHYCEQAGFKKIPMDDRHIVALEGLQLRKNEIEHNDPFDRILLAQAKAEGMLLLTHDSKFCLFDEPYFRLI